MRDHTWRWYEKPGGEIRREGKIHGYNNFQQSPFDLHFERLTTYCILRKLLLNETPELEAQRREALEREEQLSGERDAARLDLLSQLATARGQDLLQESQGQGGLLSTLEATQSKAKEIALALEESRQSLNEASRCSDKLH